MEYLEQLLAEWYEYQGYFVRRDLWVGLEDNGSYECELDLVAFHPTKNHLVHIEPCMDLLDWKQREEHFRLKFAAGKKYLHRMFVCQPTAGIDQIAVLVSVDKDRRPGIAGARIVLMPELLGEIFAQLAPQSIMSNPIPEQWPLLRTLQFVAEYRETVCETLLG